MSKRLRGPPKPRDTAGPDPPDARTFVTFAAMMVVISVVIVGIGGVLHGFPSFSGPAEPDGADTDNDTGGEEVTNGLGTNDTANEDSGPIFGDDDDGSDDDRNESADEADTGG